MRDTDTWTKTTDLVGPDPSEPFDLGVRCRNMPTDGQVGFSVVQPAPLPPLDWPLGPITNPDMVIMFSSLVWPPGASGAITVTYVQGATPPPADASITVLMLFVVEANQVDTMRF